MLGKHAALGSAPGKLNVPGIPIVLKHDDDGVKSVVRGPVKASGLPCKRPRNV